MAEQEKHNATGFSRYLRYFKDLLTRKERHRLEKHMMQDQFEEEAFDGMSSINHADLESDIAELHQGITRRTQVKKNRFIPLLKYAAAVALIISLGSIAILVKKSGTDRSKLAEQTKRIDSSEAIPVTVEVVQDTLKPKIAQTITAKKQKHSTGKEKAATPSRLDTKQDIEELSIDPPLSENVLIAAQEAEVSEAAGISVSENYISAVARKTDGREDLDLTSLSYSEEKEKNTITIKGRVMEAGYEEPLPGVNVIIKGTITGTITDLEGNFSIDIPADEKSTLEFAFVGYVSEEIEISDYNNITLALTEDLVALEEVVVIGYGTQKRSDVTGAVATIEADEIASETPQIVLPKPVGGMFDFKQYIKKNIRYNNLPAFDKPQIVKLEFTVSATGKINQIRTVKSPGTEFEAEAIRLLREGPSWEAGTIDGIPSNRKVTVRIKLTPPE